MMNKLTISHNVPSSKAHCPVSYDRLASIGIGGGSPPKKFGTKIFFGQASCNIRAVDIFLEEGKQAPFIF